MDWNNPDPTKIEYLYALWYAIHERLYVVGGCLGFSQQTSDSYTYTDYYEYSFSAPPTEKDVGNFDYLQKLVVWTKKLMHVFIDPDFYDYSNFLTQTIPDWPAQKYSTQIDISDFPKCINYLNFLNDEVDLLLLKNKKYDSDYYVNIYKGLYKILKKLTHTELIPNSSSFSQPPVTVKTPGVYAEGHRAPDKNYEESPYSFEEAMKQCKNNIGKAEIRNGSGKGGSISLMPSHRCWWQGYVMENFGKADFSNPDCPY